MERIQKILSRAGVASRRAAEDLIREGRVRLNGKVVEHLGTRADPISDKLTVDGRPAVLNRLRYYLYHKPVGVISSMSDPEGRQSIGQVVRESREHLFPVGRLDYDSSGLVLLTNDGELAQMLTHPKYGVAKVYRVKVRGHMEEKTLDRLASGVRLEDGMTLPAQVTLESRLDKKTRFVLTLHEGRQRQIRRMCEAVGHPVDKLSRVSIGTLKLGRLPPGQKRELHQEEILALWEFTRRSRPESAAPKVKGGRKPASLQRKPPAKPRTGGRRRP
jgi:23S rRNA pseudouridine2605 synthase